ncbi:MAG: tetratricopeptide repeat protein [Bacteroidota bacterium]
MCKISIWRSPPMFVFVIVALLLVQACKNETIEPEGSVNSVFEEISNQLKNIAHDSVHIDQKLIKVDKIWDKARELPNDTVKRNIYVEIADTYELLDRKELFHKYNKSYNVSSGIKDSIGMAVSHYKLGRSYFRNDQIDSSYQNFYSAERLFKSIGDDKFAGMSKLSMAIIQKNIKDYIGGEASSIEALQYFTPDNHLRYLASANTNLGLIANDLERYDLAIEYHQKALEERRAYKDSSLISSSLNNIGLAYVNKKEFDMAIEFYEAGLSYDSLFFKRSRTYTRLLDNLAYAKFLSGQPNGLPDLFLRPLELRDSLGDNLGAVTSNIHLAEYYMSIDSLQLAQKYAQVALQKATPLDYNRGILESLQLLVDTSEESQALEYSKRYSHISDSITKQERSFQEQFARIRYETDELELKNIKVTKRNRQLTILLLSLAVLSLLTYIFIQRKANKKELEFRQAQQSANEEIYQLMLSQRTKFEEGKQLEKQRISEELHDGVLGRLFGTRLNLDSLNSKNDIQVIETRAKYIDELKGIEDEIRRISHDLNSNVFSKDMLFVEVMEKLIENQCIQEEGELLKYEFVNDSFINWEEMPNNIKVHLYRIIQESLQNIRKHAQASNVRVSFKKLEKHLQLDVTDDGVGMVINKVKKGIGLKNINSRVKQIKGILSVISKKGHGTTISVKINL